MLMDQANRTFDHSVSDQNSSCLFVDSFSPREVTIQVCVLAVILILSLLGNVLLIFILLRNRWSAKRSHNSRLNGLSRKSTCNDVFFLNMGISDIFLPLAILPRELTVYYTKKDTWPLEEGWGEFSCKLYAFLENVSPSVTVLTLTYMSIDRFCAIVLPTRINLISDKTRTNMIIAIWVTGSATSSTYFFTVGARKDSQGNNKCVFEWPAGSLEDANNFFMMFNLLFYFLIPLVLMIIFYSIILTKLKAKNPVHSSQMSRKRMEIARKVTFMTVCVVGNFFLFFGPYYFVMSLVAFYWKWNYPPICSWPTVITSVKFLVFSHSAVNPVICVCLIEHHRRHVAKALTKAAREFPLSQFAVKNIFGSANSFSLQNVAESKTASTLRINGIQLNNIQ